MYLYSFLPQDTLLARLPASIIRNGTVVPIRGAVEGFLSASSTGLAAATCKGRNQDERPASAITYAEIRILPAAPAATAAAATSCSASQQHVCQQAGPMQVIEGSDAADETDAKDEQYTTLQIKSEDGKQVYLLKMPYAATVGGLRRCLDSYRAGQQQQQPQRQVNEFSQSQGKPCLLGEVGADALEECVEAQMRGKSYELRSAFPARIYADDNMSLESAQLVPSATLYMKRLC